MSARNIRSAALAWFDAKFPFVKDPIFASKFFSREESWSKTKVWFFQIPLEYIEPNRIKNFHLLCENHLEGEEFIYLKAPTLFLLMNKNSFEVERSEKVMRLYLSAEATDMFKEVRKGSKIDFRKYIQL